MFSFGRIEGPDRDMRGGPPERAMYTHPFVNIEPDWPLSPLPGALSPDGDADTRAALALWVVVVVASLDPK